MTDPPECTNVIFPFIIFLSPVERYSHVRDVNNNITNVTRLKYDRTQQNVFSYEIET